MLFDPRAPRAQLRLLLLGTLTLVSATGCIQTTPSPPPPEAFTSSSTACGPSALGQAIAPYSLGIVSSGTERGLLAADRSGAVFGLYSETSGVLESLAPSGEVTPLGAIDDEILKVQVDASHVYYSTPTGLFSMPRTGGPPLQLSPAVDDFAVSADGIYATSGTSPATIYGVAGNGAPPMPLYSAPVAVPISNLQLDGFDVYWLEARVAPSGDPSSALSVIRTAPIGATLEASDVVSVPYTSGVVSFAVLSGNVVYVTRSAAAVNGQPGSTYQVYVADAGAASVLVDSAPAGDSLGVPLASAGDGALYDLGAGVRHLWLDGLNTVTTVAPSPSPSQVNAIAIDFFGTVVFETESCVYRVATTL